MDPLYKLPPEIVLRIVNFVPISVVAALTRLTRSWHNFIESEHQDAIFSAPSKTYGAQGHRDLSFLDEVESFAKYYEGANSWKEVCKRQTLLQRNLNARNPVTRETVIQVGSDAVWRFRVDWKRRFIVSTSMSGGLNVVDLDTGNLLWRLSGDQVKPFAHLEYENGMAVFDSDENRLEVWTTDHPNQLRAVFQRTAIIPHDCTIRGFQLSDRTLCVVSNQGRGFVYDMSFHSPQLRTHFEIGEDAVGHLYQDSEVVMYCMGERGYHFYDKTSGALLGVLEPAQVQRFYHIPPPEERQNDAEPSERLLPIEIHDGTFENSSLVSPELNRSRIKLENDEWGAGILSGSQMIGISHGGRMFVCLDWKSAIQHRDSIGSGSYIIECGGQDPDYNVHVGGWLSVRDSRALFEIRGRIYVISFDVRSYPDEVRSSYCFSTRSWGDIVVPVTFMGIYDDCIMSTYTWVEDPQGRLLATKAIHVSDFAPSLEEKHPDGIGYSASAADSQNEAVTVLGTLRSLNGDPDFSDDESMVANAEADE